MNRLVAFGVGPHIPLKDGDSKHQERLLTVDDLEALQSVKWADTGRKGPLSIVNRCHEEVPLVAEYEDGVITLSCAKCRFLTARIKVGTRAIKTIPADLVY